MTTYKKNIQNQFYTIKQMKKKSLLLFPILVKYDLLITFIFYRKSVFFVVKIVKTHQNVAVLEAFHCL